MKSKSNFFLSLNHKESVSTWYLYHFYNTLIFQIEFTFEFKLYEIHAKIFIIFLLLWNIENGYLSIHRDIFNSFMQHREVFLVNKYSLFWMICSILYIELSAIFQMCAVSKKGKHNWMEIYSDVSDAIKTTFLSYILLYFSRH